MKKRMVIILSVLVLLICLGVGGYLIYNNNRVISTIVLDINPSIKISLNKDEKVLKVLSLNEDAKKIVTDDLKGKTIDKVIEVITEKVIDAGLVTEGNITIL